MLLLLPCCCCCCCCCCCWLAVAHGSKNSFNLFAAITDKKSNGIDKPLQVLAASSDGIRVGVDVVAAAVDAAVAVIAVSLFSAGVSASSCF